MNFFINRLIINEVTDLLKPKCLDKIFHFINQNNGWTLNNSTLNFSLFYSDILHSVKKVNLKLVKSILKAFDSNSNANPYKNAVCFNLNECGFPPLPSPATTSQPLHFPVKCVGPVLKLSYPVRIATATFVSHIPNICYTNASIQSFSSKLKTTSSLNFALSFHQNMLLGLLTHQILYVLVLPLLQHFLFHHRRTATELIQFLLPFYPPMLLLVLLTL